MWLINWKLYFLERKNTLSVPKFSPQNAENRILGLWSFKIFRAYLRPDPSLQCRRIVGGRNLVRVRNIVVATIFDLWQWKIGESRNSNPYGLTRPISSSLWEVSTWRFHGQIARSMKTPALQATQTPSPPRKRELTAPCWYFWSLYSTLLATSIFIETPEGHSSVLHCTTLLCIIELTVWIFQEFLRRNDLEVCCKTCKVNW